jgi:hypothetical protein
MVDSPTILRMTRVRSAALALVMLTACARTPAPAVGPAASDPGAISALEFLGEFNIPPLSTFAALKTARFGGVSGLAIDPANGDLLGICDDQEESRAFVFRVRPPARGAPLRVDLHAYFPLPSNPGAPEVLDAEGIAMTRTGRLFVSSEGVGNREPRIAPGILEYRRDYSYVGQLAVPAKFAPPATGPIDTGVRANAAFESLTLTPDEQRLYTATEGPLAQDGEPAGVDRGATARMLEYQADGHAFRSAREFAYPLAPMTPPRFTPRLLVTGLVELLAIGGDEFLAMERGYAESDDASPRRMNQIRIFWISTDGATDVSSLASLRGHGSYVPVRKRLLLDLATVQGLSPELAELDNFEGMAFGPPLPDGSRTLLLVSDDNFNTAQRTSFLLFRIRS